MNAAHSDHDGLACLICRHPELRAVDRLDGTELRRLWAEMGFELTGEAFGPITANRVVCLLECSGCGFQFFDPALAGSERFYRELEHAGYFSPLRPEFTRTLNFAEKHGLKSVCDVGCGSGAFLDLAKTRGLTTRGLELNQAAADKARAKGHVIFSELLDSVATTGERFDLITLFQVLEHLADPVGTMKQAAALLNPGGCISVAVPHAAGLLGLAAWEPHQWPPHHISRWRAKDFRTVAQASGLALWKTEGDELLGGEIERFWLLHNQLARVLGRSPRPGGSLLPKALSLLYRKLGMKFIFPRLGHSIHGYFGTPPR